jgi:hypothetical protein
VSEPPDAIVFEAETEAEADRSARAAARGAARSAPPGSSERLRWARRELRDKKVLMTPAERGEQGCLTAALRIGTVAAALIVIVSPCTAGIPLGLFGAVAGLVSGMVIGVPLVIGGSRALETVMLERRLRKLEHPKLPAGGSAPAGAPVAVGSAVEDDQSG